MWNNDKSPDKSNLAKKCDLRKTVFSGDIAKQKCRSKDFAVSGSCVVFWSPAVDCAFLRPTWIPLPDASSYGRLPAVWVILWEFQIIFEDILEMRLWSVLWSQFSCTWYCMRLSCIRCTCDKNRSRRWQRGKYMFKEPSCTTALLICFAMSYRGYNIGSEGGSLSCGSPASRN